MEQTNWQATTADAAHHIRKRVLGLTIEKNGCYLSQALSSADIFAALYTKIMRLGPSKGSMIPHTLKGLPGQHGDYETGGVYHGEKSPDTDRLLVSPSHYAVAVYAALVESGRLAPESLAQFNTDGSRLEMIGAEHSPGFELTTGSFGQCISQAGGIAYARKLRGETGRVFVFLSDGELQEGQTWEAVQSMAFFKTDNIVIFVDVNGQQVDGYTKDVMNIEPIDARFTAFGAKCVKVDGHDLDALYEATLQGEAGKPLVILCYTDSCRGLPILAHRKPKLHYVRLREDELAEYREFYANM